MMHTDIPAHKSKTQRLFYLSCLLLILAVMSLVGSLIIQSQTNKPVKPFVGYAINEKVDTGPVTLSVNKVTYNAGTGRSTAPAGKQFLIAELTIHNNTSKTISVLPSLDTFIKSTDGAVSYVTPFGLSDPFKAGSLLPGESLKGQLSYLVPKTAQLKLYVDASWSGGVIPFKVN